MVVIALSAPEMARNPRPPKLTARSGSIGHSTRDGADVTARTPLPVSSRTSPRSPVPSAGRPSIPTSRSLSGVRASAGLDLPRASSGEIPGQNPAPNPARRLSEGDPHQDLRCCSCEPVRAKSVETSSGSYPTTILHVRDGRSRAERGLRPRAGGSYVGYVVRGRGTRRVHFKGFRVQVQG
jgi:hypothetical protein